MEKPKVVVAGPFLPEGIKRLSEHCEVRQWTDSATIERALLKEWIADADGLIIHGKIKADEDLLSAGKKLRVMAQAMVGYDNVSIDACNARKILYGNTPDVLVETTAELAFGLLVCVARRINEGWDFVRAGKWQPDKPIIPYGIDLSGRTLGIIGMGRIGVAVARRAKAFNMDVIYHNRNPRKDDLEIGTRYCSLDDLLVESDAIIVLTPFTPETRGLFGKTEFEKMKDSAIFVNVARGAVVQTDALTEALQLGNIAYAALDVTDPEPLPPDHPLLNAPNILITPHIGSFTERTRNDMAMMTIDNMLAGLFGNKMPACVNPKVGK